MHSTSPGAAQNQFESLTFDDEAASSAGIVTKRSSSSKGLTKSTDEAALRLQLLRQLLADTNVPSNSQAVFNAFTKITSLKDLSSALDLLAVSPQLEESMGVDGASFQSLAVSFCEKEIKHIVKNGGDDVDENPHVKELSSKIRYYTQVSEQTPERDLLIEKLELTTELSLMIISLKVIDAYNVLHKFETESYSDGDEDINVAPRSAWAVEALAWIDTYETVTGSSIDSANKTQSRDKLRFSTFCKACGASELDSVFGKGVKDTRHHVQFTDSTRTRTEVLVHVFRPLLDDVFSFQVVNSIFDNLGISADYDYLLKVCITTELCFLCELVALSRSPHFSFRFPFSMWFLYHEVLRRVVHDTSRTASCTEELLCLELPNGAMVAGGRDQSARCRDTP